MCVYIFGGHLLYIYECLHVYACVFLTGAPLLSGSTHTERLWVNTRARLQIPRQTAPWPRDRLLPALKCWRETSWASRPGNSSQPSSQTRWLPQELSHVLNTRSQFSERRSVFDVFVFISFRPKKNLMAPRNLKRILILGSQILWSSTEAWFQSLFLHSHESKSWN